MNGDWGVLRLLLATVAMVVIPPICAIVLGGLQVLVYRAVKSEPPVFPILVMRGMMVVLALIAVTVFYLKFGLGQPGFQNSSAPTN